LSCWRIKTLKEGLSAPAGIENEPAFLLFRDVRLITKQDMRSGSEFQISFSAKKNDEFRSESNNSFAELALLRRSAGDSPQ
jgi:hypothetical protein